MGARVFQLHLIKPSHYDDDGYVIQWLRSAIPSNSLAVMNGLASDCRARQVLGPDVEIDIRCADETNTRIRPDRIAREIKAAGSGLVCFVGVQSNQYPRTMDLARRLRAEGIQVAIGGFHVSGCIAMLPTMPPELKEAQDLGISLYAGEAEGGRLDEVFRDALAGTLKPLYNHMNDLPGIEAVPAPFLPANVVSRTSASVTSFDAGRGCPFQCSFCTIINVQGRKSRYRTGDDIEAIVRANVAQGVKRFFITDDNIARNKNWEEIFDRLIKIRSEGIYCSFIIQVDTLCHLIPNFIEKAAAAGIKRVFIGLENISPENLIAAKKKQNRIAEYRTMLLAWKAAGCITYCGYITGFPADTPETIARDIEIIKRELPLDLLEFFYLTPLPGSEDHQKHVAAGKPLDPDLNKYDLDHAVAPHATMSKEVWEKVIHDAWKSYYSMDHMKTIMRRAAATPTLSLGNVLFLMMWFWTAINLEGVHPLEAGFLRRKVRRDRRPGMALENPFLFYPKYVGGLIWKHLVVVGMLARFEVLRRTLKDNPKALAYRDRATSPDVGDVLDELEMFNVTAASRAAAEKGVAQMHRQREHRAEKEARASA
jgi:hypothetical protein